jgi:hypothetical protein
MNVIKYVVTKLADDSIANGNHDQRLYRTPIEKLEIQTPLKQRRKCRLHQSRYHKDSNQRW